MWESSAAPALFYSNPGYESNPGFFMPKIGHKKLLGLKSQALVHSEVYLADLKKSELHGFRRLF